MTHTARPDPTSNDPVLRVRDLTVHYDTPQGPVMAVTGMDLDVMRGEILGVVGESGCGKTTAAMGILRLVQPPGRIVSGRVLLEDTDLLTLSRPKLRQVRWRKLALIPQGAMNSLNPVLKIGRQVADGITAHEKNAAGRPLRKRTTDLIDMVQLPSRVIDMFPHELSGGMKQRVCIAMAVALNPPLIIADEPTSALDVMVQHAVAQTLLDVKRRLGVSVVLIGHDMGLMAQMADRVAVMYAGHVVEIAPVRRIFARPLHPYTKLLIESVPTIRHRRPLQVTAGLTHDLRRPPAGCVFGDRCPAVMDVCRQQAPPLRPLQQAHVAACHLYENVDGKLRNVSDGSVVDG